MEKTKGYNIDEDFVSTREGDTVHMYVPQKTRGVPFPNSGVTIGKGFDLASKSTDTLLDMGVSEATITKLKPYLGLKGQKAYNFLKDVGDMSLPVFSNSEIKDLNHKSFVWHADKIARQYENKSEGKKFMDLSRAQQTVLFSVGYQYGASFTRKDGSEMNFIKQAAKGNWENVYKELMNFGDNHSSRRKQEAQLLFKDLISSKIIK